MADQEQKTEITIFDVMRNMPVRYAGKLSEKPVIIPAEYKQKPNEIRGIWVCTVKNLDFPVCASTQDFKKNVSDLFNRIRLAGFNTVAFQIRPCNDAFYPSSINPYSKYLTGTEGEFLRGEKMNILEYMIQEAHKRNLSFHAWLNPYRLENETKLTKDNFIQTLSKNNFAAKNPDCVLSIPNSNGTSVMMLDPGNPKVLLHLLSTIRELVENYDMDAIHFDDYFYPYTPMKYADLKTFIQTKKNTIPIEEWRRENVNRCIRLIHRLIQQNNEKQGKKILFGISPFGIWANQSQSAEGSLSSGSQSYFDQYADTRKWIREGWIDYIVPQLYWAFGNERAPYAALTDWWADQVRGTNVQLYIGHGIYQEGSGGHWKNPEEIANQLRYNSACPDVSGSFFF